MFRRFFRRFSRTFATEDQTLTDPRPSIESRGSPRCQGVDLISFEVEGTPKAQPRMIRRGLALVPDGSADPWKHAVRACCKLALMRADVRGLIPLGVAVAVEMVFRFGRPKKHFGSGRNADMLRADAPTFHTAKPDGDNLAKAVLDAVSDFDRLPSLVWCDDQQVAYGPPLKLYADPGQPAGATVTIYRLEKVPGMLDLLTAHDLTSGETLEVDRRRAGLSLDAAAGLQGISPGRYRKLEREGVEDLRVDLGRLEAWEQSFILRQRHKLTPTDICERTGLSATWINKAERGLIRNSDVLLEWWARQTEFNTLNTP